MIPALALAAALAVGAGAQTDAPSGAGATADVENADTELARRAADALGNDEGMRASLARRILDSSLADQISGGGSDREKAQASAAAWVREHPDDAAHLAIGFARDDENGNREFETSLHERVVRYLGLNPDRYQGILGVLSAAGKESKLIKKLEKKMDEEEQRELIKRLFEGQGGEQGRVLKQPNDGPSAKPADPNAPGAVGGSSVYDRLSELNPSGYSPKVLSLQSALNAQRPAGAPKLIETGRLDFATLAFPLYALRADMNRQDAGLRARRAWAIAHALGRDREFKNEQYSDAALQAQLEKSASKVKLPPRIQRRRNALERAAAAVADFQREAERMKDPKAINRAGLRTLSGRQKEASRWLVIASLEGDLSRLEDEALFWTPQLETLIKTAPAPEPARRGFLLRGRAVLDRLARIRGHDENALALLLRDDYAPRWAEMERELSDGNSLRQDLTRDIALVGRVPGSLHAAGQPAVGWRGWLERLLRRFAPSSAFAKQAETRERRANGWSEAFALVATGDFKRAQRAADDATR